MNEEDEAFEQLALKQGQWEHTSGWRKRQIERDFAAIDDANNIRKKQIMDTQAFPNPHRTDMTGMSLRDYFAAKAMQAYLADKELIDLFVYMNADVKEQVALAAYQMADAMLKAREAQRTEQNFCPRCGKRTADKTVIHTCTPPPQEKT